MSIEKKTYHPIRWTLEITEVGILDGKGRIGVYAGGPIIDGPSKAPTKRLDGKIDGRSAGSRKCGKCGLSGHNARTCGRRK